MTTTRRPERAMGHERRIALTAPQRAVYDCIRDSLRIAGYPPTHCITSDRHRNDGRFTLRPMGPTGPEGRGWPCGLSSSCDGLATEMRVGEAEPLLDIVTAVQ